MTARIDGRRLRSRRTHDRLVGAYLDLVAETGGAPTCGEVARRAGCSVRTLFDRFRDMAALARAASERVSGHEGEAGGAAGPLDRAARIRLHVAARARQCERWTLEAANEADDLAGFAELETIYYRELAPLDAAERRKLLIALGTLTDFGGWARIRRRFGTSIAEACEVWQVAIDRLLPPTPG